MENYQENNENKMEKDDIVNPEQFQVGRAPQDEKEETKEQDMVNRSDDAGYTAEENQFADGKGTQLDEEIDQSSSNADDL
jgi:hypothetical protein